MTLASLSPSACSRTSIETGLAIAALVVGTGCSTNQSAQKDSAIDMEKPNVTTETKGDQVVRRFDLDGNGEPEVVRFYKRTKTSNQEGDDSSEQENGDSSDSNKEEGRRLVRKEIDVDYDGQIDVVRHYTENGELDREKVDLDRDGTFDIVNHFKGESELARKELLGKKGKQVVAIRFYAEGKLSKVKRDTDANGTFDYWEFYQDEELKRIGYDEDGDEKVDRWVHRETKVASGTNDDLPGGEDAPAEGGGGDTSGGDS
jgi:hypothetical protein